MSKKLNEMLKPEAYPYQRGITPRFAQAIKNKPDGLIEAFRSASGGQGVNSRASFSSALDQLENLPEVRKSRLIPFPFWDNGQTIIGQIPVGVARKIVEKFS